MASITWKTDAGGIDISDAANWTGGVVPGSNDTAVIPSGCSNFPGDGICAAHNITLNYTNAEIDGGTWTGTGILTDTGGAAKIFGGEFSQAVNLVNGTTINNSNIDAIFHALVDISNSGGMAVLGPADYRGGIEFGFGPVKYVADVQVADAATLTGTTLNAAGADTAVAFGASNGTAKSKAVYDSAYADAIAEINADDSVITITHANGSHTVYVPSADTAIARGTALRSAVAAVVSGETLEIGKNGYAGIYHVGSSSQLALPAGIIINGQGKTKTRITSAYEAGGGSGQPGDSNFDTFIFGHEDEINDLWLEMNNGSTNRIIQVVGQTAGSIVKFHNVRVTGFSDCFYPTHPSLTASYLYLENCDLLSNWDAYHTSLPNVFLIAKDTSFNYYYRADTQTLSRSIVLDLAGPTVWLDNCRFNVIGPTLTQAGALSREIFGILLQVPGAYDIKLDNCIFNLTMEPGRGRSLDIHCLLNTNPVIARNCRGSNTDGTLNVVGSIQEYHGSTLLNSPTAITIALPTNLAGTISYGSGAYTANSYYMVYSIVAYKTVDGKRVHSAVLQSEAIESDSSNRASSIHLTWTASEDQAVEGYIVTMAGYGAYMDDVYYDAGNVASWIDDGSHWQGPVVSADSSPPTGDVIVFNNLVPVSVLALDSTVAKDATVSKFNPATTTVKANDASGNALPAKTDVTVLGTAALATSSQVANIQNNTFIATDIPQILERPDTSSAAVALTLTIRNDTGAATDIDSSGLPTVTLVNEAGTSRASRLSAWTHAATGKYTAIYTNTSTDPIENLKWEISATVNTKAYLYVARMQIVETTAVNFTSDDRTILTNLGTAISTIASHSALTVSGTQEDADGTYYLIEYGIERLPYFAKIDSFGNLIWYLWYCFDDGPVVNQWVISNTPPPLGINDTGQVPASYWHLASTSPVGTYTAVGYQNAAVASGDYASNGTLFDLAFSAANRTGRLPADPADNPRVQNAVAAAEAAATALGIAGNGLTNIPIPATPTAGSVQKLLKDNLDTKVSEAGGGLTEEQAAIIELIKGKTDLITTNIINVVSPLSGQAKILTLVAGDSYDRANAHPIEITPKVWIDPSDATIYLYITDLENPEATPLEIQGSSVEVEEPYFYRFRPTWDSTSTLNRAEAGRYEFSIRYKYENGDIMTVLFGACRVKK